MLSGKVKLSWFILSLVVVSKLEKPRLLLPPLWPTMAEMHQDLP